MNILTKNVRNKKICKESSIQNNFKKLLNLSKKI